MSFRSNKHWLILLFIIGSSLVALPAMGASDTPAVNHSILEILPQLMVILIAAKLGGDVFERIKQPPVLGELLFGVLVGNLHLVGLHFFDQIATSMPLEILAEIGIIILLFEVGLESTVSEMMKVGLTSLLVAMTGVILPFFLGWGVGVWLLPHESLFVHIFIGATLTATSVGITARVLKDIHKANSKEGRIILGAAVIDDILGLIILAVVGGVIASVAAGTGGSVDTALVLWICAKAVLFILGAILLGAFVLPRLFNLVVHLKGNAVLLSFVLIICFGLAWMAGLIGLAPIVGAFAAGLILDKVQYRQFTDRGEHELEELISPIAAFLVPIFFVRMGAMVDLATFGDVGILGLAAVVTLVAIVGKQACSLVVWGKGINRFAIGLGMIPRGEVGLIFAGIGSKLILDGQPVITSSTYSAIIIMVIVTTLVTPPLLKYSLRK